VKDHVAGVELGVTCTLARHRRRKNQRRYAAGCRRFDSALTGLGGCPFAGDDLVGNIPTESVLAALTKLGATHDFTLPNSPNPSPDKRHFRAKYMHAE